jgi:hypothetical protein
LEFSTLSSYWSIGFPDFYKNCFKKGQVATCNFSKEICANPRNLSTNRKKVISPGSFEEKLLGDFKNFLC